MPNQKKTLIALVLDRSGSMKPLQLETIGGVNTLIADQQKEPGECDFTLVQFSTDYTFTYNAIPIRDAALLTAKTYEPEGSTALLDAMGRCIDETGKRLAAMSEADRPAKVVIVIVTDGQENASHVFNKAQISERVEHQQKKYGWQFVFLGANMDAISGAADVGISGAMAMNYVASSAGVGQVYRSTSKKLSDHRNFSAPMSWSKQDRADNSVNPIADQIPDADAVSTTKP